MAKRKLDIDDVIDLTTETECGLPGQNYSLQHRELFVDSGIYLSAVEGFENDCGSYSIDHLLTTLIDWTCMLQLNYKVDLDWMMERIPAHKRTTASVSLFHGLTGEERTNLQEQSRRYPNVRLSVPSLPIPYGTHHTKAMFFFDEANDRMRMIIHTANLIPRDWAKKTQGMWISPLLRPKSQTSPPQSEFQDSLFGYLGRYPVSSMNNFLQKMSMFDFSTCRAVLVGCVPGYHSGSDLSRWGHMRIRNILKNVDGVDDCSNERSEVICQFSSVGSFDEGWLSSELFESLSTTRHSSSAILRPQLPRPCLRLIYPTVENVRTSLEGWCAGNSLPFDQKNYSKQRTFMRPRLCTWSARRANRHRAMPHIKTYTRIKADKIEWFLLGSMNLSKAAFGALQKNGKQLMVRSYELGVLIYPGLFKDLSNRVSLHSVTPDFLSSSTILDAQDVRGILPDSSKRRKIVSSESDQSLIVPIRLPFDIPVSPYAAEDEAWTWNVERKYADVFGCVREM
ncbi:tyrosyl-DNA phosphodiesterase I [Cladochytrium replicatum]|nr:tyrosyl-DNA phosphodiesterase I [Cladochytrium replicatum]